MQDHILIMSDSKFTFRIDSDDKERMLKAAKSERLSGGPFIRTHIMKIVEDMGF